MPASRHDGSGCVPLTESAKPIKLVEARGRELTGMDRMNRIKKKR
jgi:hypothetical protein